MQRRSSRTRRRLLRLVLLTLAGWALVALGRSSARTPQAPPPVEPPRALPPVPAVLEAARRRHRTRRVAATLAFAALFAVGASFSAVAGDQAAQLLEPEPEQVAEPVPASEAEPVAEPEPAAEPAPEPASVPAAEPEPEPVPAAQPESAPAAQPEPLAEAPAPASAGRNARPAAVAPAPTRSSAQRTPAVAAPRPVAPAPAAAHTHGHEGAPAGAMTVWLNRQLPDPTPPSLRLAPQLMGTLRSEARRAGADWALVLAVLRADGARTSVPARPLTIAQTADRLAGLGASRDAWGAVLALTGRTAMADRAVALARYYRAVGAAALVRGLAAEKEALARRVLADPRIDLYAGGRADVEAGRTDVRILALVAYLAESFDQVTVSSLVSGHRLFARPGVVSAHVYGHAVDVAALGGSPILGNSAPGGIAERAVREILLLPAEMRPRQVISLLGLGGPSFPLADHADHIHVGF